MPADEHLGFQFGAFGDRRDEYEDTALYQPRGSKHRFQLERNALGVTARKLGPPDEILPGGRAVKSLAGGLAVWGGGTGSPEGHREIMKVEVRKGYRGKGLAGAMLAHAMRDPRNVNLSHSTALSEEGAQFARRYPLPGDTERTRQAQRRVLGD